MSHQLPSLPAPHRVSTHRRRFPRMGSRLPSILNFEDVESRVFVLDWSSSIYTMLSIWVFWVEYGEYAMQCVWIMWDMEGTCGACEVGSTGYGVCTTIPMPNHGSKALARDTEVAMLWRVPDARTKTLMVTLLLRRWWFVCSPPLTSRERRTNRSCRSLFRWPRERRSRRKPRAAGRTA